MPVDIGSITFNIAAAATAASTAFPPSRNIWIPASAANGWLVTTIPYLLITVDRDGPNRFGRSKASGNMS
jgi:hypothetical protein